jgi:hypothetical protein
VSFETIFTTGILDRIKSRGRPGPTCRAESSYPLGVIPPALEASSNRQPIYARVGEEIVAVEAGCITGQVMAGHIVVIGDIAACTPNGENCSLVSAIAVARATSGCAASRLGNAGGKAI